jgi:rhodanese-related sulfurtransferase
MTMSLLPGVALAVVAGCGGNHGGTPASLVDVAQAAARGSDSIAVEDLAQWLVEGRQDFVLVDVREPGDFGQGSIGDARNLSIAELVTEDVLADLPRDRKVVVYSNGSETGAKASVLLRLAGVDAHVLSGGYNAWHARILNPDIPAEEQPGESLQVSEQRALACYFVGERSGEGAAERPKIEFVPPVYTESEGDEKRPAPAAEESC